MNTLVEWAREYLAVRAPKWTVESTSALTCPHGHRVEWDGECPEGCVSPIRKAGLI